MPGMLTPRRWRSSPPRNGVEFDRLFLEGMIKHHSGALTMVEELFATPGAGQEPEIFRVRVGCGCGSADGDRSHGCDAQGASEMKFGRRYPSRVYGRDARLRRSAARAQQRPADPPIRASD